MPQLGLSRFGNNGVKSVSIHVLSWLTTMYMEILFGDVSTPKKRTLEAVNEVLCGRKNILELDIQNDLAAWRVLQALADHCDELEYAEGGSTKRKGGGAEAGVSKKAKSSAAKPATKVSVADDDG